MAERHDQHEAYDEMELAAIQPFVARYDAESYGDNSVWIARQLDYVKARTYERQLPAINADRLVPDATDTPEWAETITISTYDMVGMAKIVSNYADDLPRADVNAAQKQVPVRTLGDSYGYNVNELRASRATGVGLDTRKANAARRAVDLKIASIKMKGDTAFGLYGLFNFPNVPVTTLPTAGAWSGLTGDQILTNMIAMINAYTVQTLGTHTPNALCLAPTAYNAAATKFLTVAGAVGITALQVFRQNYPGIAVENVFECTGAGTASPGVGAGKDVALLYERSSDNLAHEMVMAFTQLPAEARNLELVTDCLARSGGVQIYYPLALLMAATS